MELKDIIREYNLDETELEVLRSLAKQMMDCAAGACGYAQDAFYGNLRWKQFERYVSKLDKKGVFEYYHEDFDGEYALKPEILRALI